MFEFRINPDNIDLFRAFMGIKSIIGTRDFNITHKKIILFRMFGCKTENALKEFLKPNKQAKDLFNKYSKRYWTDWLLDELEKQNFITKISYPRYGICKSSKFNSKG